MAYKYRSNELCADIFGVRKCIIGYDQLPGNGKCTILDQLICSKMFYHHNFDDFFTNLNRNPSILPRKWNVSLPELTFKYISILYGNVLIIWINLPLCVVSGIFHRDTIKRTMMTIEEMNRPLDNIHIYRHGFEPRPS